MSLDPRIRAFFGVLSFGMFIATLILIWGKCAP